jgi:phytoene dehydrogenase-like protein
MSHYDSIIIGAGHNGLVCAAYLARAGQRVLVLEAGSSPGGLAADREFHPGFHAPVAHTISHFSDRVAGDLDLTRHGFGPASQSLPLIGMGENAQVVVDDTVSGISDSDAAALGEFQALLHKFASALEPFWAQTLPRIGSQSFGDIWTFAKMGLGLRRMGRKDMGEFLRIAALPMRDLVDEYFESDALKAMLCWDGLIGSKMAPRSPNSAVLALLYRMAGNAAGRHIVPAGGVAGLVAALVKAAESGGAEIRMNAPAGRILVRADSDGLQATGVRLADGEVVEAARIISAADPRRTFLDLVGVEYLDIGFTNRIRRIRGDGYVGKLHLALDGAPTFAGLDDPGGRMILASSVDEIELCYDDAKYGDIPDNPVMEVVVPSVHDGSLAPTGNHVLSAHVMYLPCHPKTGWTEEARNRAKTSALARLEKVSPGIADQVIHAEFLSPADLESEYHVAGGHWHHGDFAMDQMLMMRPTYEAAQHATPIPGLFLCSAGCHPGGDVTGMPGHNAAKEILR